MSELMPGSHVHKHKGCTSGGLRRIFFAFSFLFLIRTKILKFHILSVCPVEHTHCTGTTTGAPQKMQGEKKLKKKIARLRKKSKPTERKTKSQKSKARTTKNQKPQKPKRQETKSQKPTKNQKPTHFLLGVGLLC